MASKIKENISIRAGGKAYRRGDEKALSEVITQDQADALVAAGKFDGDSFKGKAKEPAAVRGRASQALERRSQAMAGELRAALGVGEPPQAKPKAAAKPKEAPAADNTNGGGDDTDTSAAGAPALGNADELEGPFKAIKLGGGWYGVADANDVEAMGEDGDPFRVQGEDNASAAVEALNSQAGE